MHTSMINVSLPLALVAVLFASSLPCSPVPMLSPHPGRNLINLVTTSPQQNRRRQSQPDPRHPVEVTVTAEAGGAQSPVSHRSARTRPQQLREKTAAARSAHGVGRVAGGGHADRPLSMQLESLSFPSGDDEDDDVVADLPEQPSFVSLPALERRDESQHRSEASMLAVFWFCRCVRPCVRLASACGFPARGLFRIARHLSDAGCYKCANVSVARTAAVLICPLPLCARIQMQLA